MRTDVKRRLGLGAGVVALVASLVPLAGQTKSPIPRMKDGHPDLQGTYDIATLTPIERQAGSPLVLTDDEAKKLERDVAARKNYQARPIETDRTAPPVGGDGSQGAAGNVGGYNSFWIDSGSQYTVVDGRRRASILIDPPEGRIPAVTAQGRQRMTR